MSKRNLRKQQTSKRPKYRPQKGMRCPNCGKFESHFVPPSFGDEGFFTCKKGATEGRKEGVEYEDTSKRE